MVGQPDFGFWKLSRSNTPGATVVVGAIGVVDAVVGASWASVNCPASFDGSTAVAAQRKPVSAMTDSFVGSTAWRIAAPSRTRPYSPPRRTR